MQCNNNYYYTIQYNAIQYNAMQYKNNTIQKDTIWYDSVAGQTSAVSSPLKKMESKRKSK